MMERISRQRHIIRKSAIDIGERTTGQQCRYDRNGDEREEVDEISFHLGTRLDHDDVDPCPP